MIVYFLFYLRLLFLKTTFTGVGGSVSYSCLVSYAEWQAEQNQQLLLPIRGQTQLKTVISRADKQGVFL